MAFQCIRCKHELDKSFRACPHCGEPVTDFLRRYSEQPLDGKYEILDRLGTGGMGEVFKVRHTYLGALRVIKVIRPQISESRDAHDRFLREARLATKVQHPNVATLHDFSALPDGSHYMVWEYIDGENLAQRVRARGQLPPRYAVHIAIQMLQGLDAIHRAGIVHRDISPENVMLTRDEHDEERVKIIDLGVAKAEEVDSGTRTGIFIGKLRYASPEHLGFLKEGERIDGRADLYSVAIVLYEMLTGRPPFEATSPHQYVLLHSREEAFRPLDLPPDLPGGAHLQMVLARALERDRNKRYATARELARALAEVEQTLPDTSRMRTFAQDYDADATMRVTPAPESTLHRATSRTPLPTPPPTPPPRPSRRETTTDYDRYAAPQRRGGGMPLGPALGLVGIVGLAAIALIVWLLMRDRVPQPGPINPGPNPNPPYPNVITDKTTTSGTNVYVTPDTAPVVETAPATQPPAPKPIVPQPVVPKPTPAPAPQPQPQPPSPQPQPRPEPEPEPEPQPQRRPQPQPSSAPTYIEGGDNNEEAAAALSRALSGASSISVRGSNELANILKEHIPVSDDADVVITFSGNIERLSRVTKRRSGEATVTKNGRVVFRYRMEPQNYRVGDTPAEAFARVVEDALP